MDKSQIVALPVAMTALRSAILKAFLPPQCDVWREKKHPKAVQRLLFIKKCWSLVQLEIAILHFLTKTGGGHRINIVSVFDGLFLLNAWGICDLVPNVMFRNCMVSFWKSQVRISEDKEVRLKRGKIWSSEYSFIKTCKRELWKNTSENAEGKVCVNASIIDWVQKPRFLVKNQSEWTPVIATAEVWTVQVERNLNKTN